MAVPHRKYQRSQRQTAVRQPGKGLGVEENLLLGENRTEQRQHIPDAELLEQKGHPATGHRHTPVQRWLDQLPVRGAQAELERAGAGRGYDHHAQQVADEGFQPDGFAARCHHPLHVHRVDESQAVAKNVRHVVLRDQGQALGGKHDAVVHGEGYAGDGVSGERGAAYCDKRKSAFVHNILTLFVYSSQF